MNSTPEEFAFDIAGVRLAGKRWRNGARPVLALHGWLDNAASFDRLAPLLDGADVVALDLAGHGLSYHRTPQSTYNVWDDLPDLLRLADFLDWPRFHLIGHSRGAIIGALLTAAMPERVESLVLLDGLAPDTATAESYFDQLAIHLREHLTAANRPTICYPGIERALLVRCRVTGMSEESARPIVERGLCPVEGGVRWRADPRLQLPSAVKLNPQQVAELKRRLGEGRRTLLIVAEQGLGARLRGAHQLGELAGIEVVELSGGHHFHLETAALDIARHALQWWHRLDNQTGNQL